MGGFLVLGLVLCVPFLFLLKELLLRYSSLQGLPPGPKGIPLLGNVFNMPDPAQKAHLHWREFKMLYGPMSSVTVLGKAIVILNGYDTAVELLEKNSAVFSGRAPLTFVGEMYNESSVSKNLFLTHLHRNTYRVGWGRILPFSQYGDLLRQYRRDWHQFLGTYSAVERFMPMLEVENKRFLNRVLQDHASWRDQLRKYVMLLLFYRYNKTSAYIGLPGQIFCEFYMVT